MTLDDRVSYEGFWRRALAGLVDCVLATIIVVTLVLVGQAAGEDGASAPVLAAELSRLPAHASWLAAMIVAAQTLFWSFLRATPGMLLLGCQVLNATSGRRLSLPRSFLRAAGLWLGLACLGVGVLWIIRDRRHQGLHDKLAGSVVVREDESLMALDELLESVK